MRDRLDALVNGTPADDFVVGDVIGRWPRGALVAIHVPFLAFVGFQATFGANAAHPGRPLAAIPLLVSIAAIQLRHAFAAADGDRPRWWPLTFGALLVLVYAPVAGWTYNWATTQWFVVASAAMLLPRAPAVVGIVGPVVGTATTDAVHVAVVGTDASIGSLVWTFVYTATVFALGGIGLYGGVRVVRTLVELTSTRDTLATMAAARERLRMARDLHDVLGQSLSAVSLKGDLALRLLDAGQPQARAEIDDLTVLARTALHDVRAVALDERDVTMARELAGARSLLGAAGIGATIAIGAVELDPRVDTLFGWTIREGLTNVLRHSDATACAITAADDGDHVVLTIVNDGVGGELGAGSGLDGLRERAVGVGATCTSGVTHDRFMLCVRAPRRPA